MLIITVYSVFLDISFEILYRNPLLCCTCAKCTNLVIEYVEKFDPIVIACERDYEAVMSSYRKRKGDEAQAHYDKNFEGWQKILEKVTPHVILSVDADDRQDRLDDLSSLLGVDLDPQGWGKVGSWEDKNRGRGRNWSI